MGNRFTGIPERERIITALDCPMSEALAIADALQGHATWLKVGMTLFYAEGPKIVHQFKEQGFKVFLDLKFNDIPHQVEGAAASATLCGADMLTMHATGGVAMMRAAQRGVMAAAEKRGSETPITLGITVLTSMNETDLADIGVGGEIQEQVLRLAELTQCAGISGVVASPQEAAILREQLGSDAFIVTPGVRPIGSDKGDQNRVATPYEAFEFGASHIVVGRPIVSAADPVEAFEAIVKGIEDESRRDK